MLTELNLKTRHTENIDHAHMYPVREMSEILGYTVEWNDEEKSCLVSSETVPSVKFYIGEDKYVLWKPMPMQNSRLFRK